MAGYNGYSKSNNAVRAEANGIYPLTQATKQIAKLAGITAKEARAVLDELGPDEYHHTSKNYNCTNYYSVDTALHYLAESGNETAYEAMRDRRKIYRPGKCPSFKDIQY